MFFLLITNDMKQIFFSFRSLVFVLLMMLILSLTQCRSKKEATEPIKDNKQDYEDFKEKEKDFFDPE